MVVELGVIKHGETRSNRAAFRIGRAVDEAVDASLNHCAGAHGAGLDGHVKGGAHQAVVAYGCGGFAQSDYFGVSCRVAVGNRTVAGACDDGAIENNNCADRDFAPVRRFSRVVERGLHELLVWLG